MEHTHSDFANRWCDIAIHYIVYANGAVSGTLEHSGLDAVPMVRQADEMCRHLAIIESATKTDTSLPSPVPPRPATRMLWATDELPQVRKLIATTRDAHVLLAARLDIATIAAHGSEICTGSHASLAVPIAHTYQRSPTTGGRTGDSRASECMFSKVAFKALRVSPDALVQIALQLSYRRCFGEHVSTYVPYGLRSRRREAILAYKYVYYSLTVQCIYTCICCF